MGERRGRTISSLALGGGAAALPSSNSASTRSSSTPTESRLARSLSSLDFSSLASLSCSFLVGAASFALPAGERFSCRALCCSKSRSHFWYSARSAIAAEVTVAGVSITLAMSRQPLARHTASNPPRCVTLS